VGFCTAGAKGIGGGDVKSACGLPKSNLQATSKWLNRLAFAVFNWQWSASIILDISERPSR
jgi:hypothetical protein